MSYLSLPIGGNAPELVNAVIEIPAGGVNKYEGDAGENSAAWRST